MQTFRWPLLFFTVLGFLIFTLYASVAFTGLSAWAIGFVYIAYDTFLLGFMVVSSFLSVREQEAKSPVLMSSVARPSLGILLCARNERLILPSCLAALANQTEPADEILILDDGSTDGMADWITDEYAMTFTEEKAGRLGVSTIWPALKLWCKPNSGKADSLNQGLTRLIQDIVVTLDADTLIEPAALAAVRDGFAEDSTLAIAGGVLTPICQFSSSAKFFQFFQTFEYARGFLWRLTWMRYRMLLLISGAFAAYRRSVLVEVGGFDPTSWVEDYELTHRIYRQIIDRGLNVSVKTLAGARGTTDAPASWRTFLNQRRRWFGGFIATHFEYQDMVGNPRYGRVGRYMLCLKTIDLLLPIYALAAAVVLIVFLLAGRTIDPFIIKIILIKLAYDLTLHAYAIYLYQRWLGIPLSRKLWLKSIGATLSEPFVFQILRQLGAVFGWLAFLQRKIDWIPQRPAAAIRLKNAKVS